MARTGKRNTQTGIAKVSSDLATIGAEHGFSEKEIAEIFSSVARECTTRVDKVRFIKFCSASGLSPWKRDIFAIAYGRDSKRRVEFVTSYHVFMSRCRAAGYIARGQDVCENDVFEGWDAANLRPVKHVIPPKGRGKPLGAYAQAIDVKTGAIVAGNYWEANVLLSDNPNPLRTKIPGYFCWKTAVGRIARTVAPDLASLYMAEEFGVLASTNPAEDAVPDEARDVATGDVVDQLERQGQGATSTSDDIKAAVGETLDVDSEPAGDDSGDAEPDPSAPLAFKQRTAVMKAVAKLGHTSQAKIGAYLRDKLGRAASPMDLNQGDLAKLIEAGLEVEL